MSTHDGFLQTRDPVGLARRKFLAAGGAIAAGLALGGRLGAQEKPAAEPFALGALPYPHDALEPAIDRQTMEIHHGKHHAAYVQNLNKAVAGTPLASKPIDVLLRELVSLPPEVQTAVRNHGGGHHNHTLFWGGMKPKGGGEPGGKLGAAISAAFGSFEKLKALFSDKALKQFGSGWAWLVEAEGRLAVISLPNQDSPLSSGQKPLLGIDVWEHAYYLRYQNRRADYIAAWWSVVNWDEVAKRLG